MTLKEMIFADITKIKSYLIITICIISVLLTPGLAKGQTRKTDSLRQILKTSGQDTNRVKTLNNLAFEISSYNPDTSIIIAGEALSLSQKLKWKKGEALSELRLGIINYNKANYNDVIVHYTNALNICERLIVSKNSAEAKAGRGIKAKTLGNLANLYKNQSRYLIALEYYFKSLKISEELGDKSGVGRTLGGIANVYTAQSDYPKALEYCLKGLKISEETADKHGTERTLGSIAALYFFQKDYKKALQYYLQILKISEEVGDKTQVAATFVNLANVYYAQSNYPKALEYYLKGLKLSEEGGNKKQVGITLGNLAAVYADEGHAAIERGNTSFAKGAIYPKALDYYSRSLKIAEELGDKESIGFTLGNIGSIYTTLGKYKEAEDHLRRALLIVKEIGSGAGEQIQHNSLVILYEKTNRPALALEHYKKYISLRDTIFSQENSKKLMRSEMDHEYEKKKAITDAEHNMEIQNQKLIAGEKNKKQNIIIGSVVTGLALVLIFVGFIFRSLRITAKQKRIIELKNVETEHQKKEIEEKQKEILDSIHYAKRIQLAQIPSEKRVGNILIRLKKR